MVKFEPSTIRGKLKSFLELFWGQLIYGRYQISLSALMLHSLNNHCVPHDQIISMYLPYEVR